MLEVMSKIISDIKDPDFPASSWQDYGEIIFCENKEELCRVNDLYAAEHVQIIADDLDFWVNKLRNLKKIIFFVKVTF